MEITRVLLADDHPRVRAGIRNLLEKASDIEVIGEAGDGEEALKLAEDLSPDVLLLDMEMPQMSGVEVARKLRDQGSPVRIVVLSAYHDRQYIKAMLSTGASGYLTKDEAPEKIVRAVRSAAHEQDAWGSLRGAAIFELKTKDQSKGR